MPVNPEQYRLNPRPSYYDASSRTEVQITLDFETWLLYLSGIEKRALIGKLQKAVVGTSSVHGARDNLYRAALLNKAQQAGAEITELDASLSEFAGTTANSYDTGSAVEIGKLLEDAGSGDAEQRHARQNAFNSLVHASVANANIKQPDTKRQIRSWIQIITTYITE